jgi:hypothetical protein
MAGIFYFGGLILWLNLRKISKRVNSYWMMYLVFDVYLALFLKAIVGYELWQANSIKPSFTSRFIALMAASRRLADSRL